MRKQILAAMIIIVIVMFATYSIYQSQRVEAMSELALANVEALANDENTGGNQKCYSTVTIESESVTDGVDTVKIYECETHTCIHGDGGLCSTGCRCVYYSGPNVGNDSGSIYQTSCK